MEFALLPVHRGHPPIAIPRTKYFPHQRYDGGSWASYPSRIGKPITAWDGKTLDLQEYHRMMRVNPTSLEDLQPFIQTWLYFGLLAEFLSVNLSGLGINSPVAGGQAIVTAIYEATLVQDGDKTNVRMDDDTLNSFLQSTRSRLPKDPATRKSYYEHLNLCLSYTNLILSALPIEFDHSVKCSISALAELLMYTVNLGFQHLGVKQGFGRFWNANFLDKEAKDSMKNHGWCVSDITRLEAKYKSVQGLHTARMMDKSLPRRNHQSCSESVCKYFQVNMREFQLAHQEDGCSCSPLEVDGEDLTKILRKDGIFPLLHFTGDLHNLEVELVEFALGVPYVAISHVWADGLGNPKSNSLNRCKLHHLGKLVASIDSNGLGEGTPLIWLDTLVSPALDGDGKQLAIEKIRLVYKQAKHVLVLDAGLMSYTASDQEEFEQLTRIFTSGWMRRLWTLQEGALAKSLYFQFADKAVSLTALMESLSRKCNQVKNLAIFTDLWAEFQGLVSFFHPVPGPESYDKWGLARLDQSLKFRSLSVSTDESLCIGTLMSLNMREILDVEDKEKRMQKVWELIAEKNGGIPRQVIFLEEPRIDVPGWRWASRSLLVWLNGAHDLVNTRILRWTESQMGKRTDRGLLVQYPGYRIKIATEDREQPQLWPGFTRLPELDILFRDKDSGLWYRILDKEYSRLSLTWTEDEKLSYNKLRLFPLHDLADTDNAVLIINHIGGPFLEPNEGYLGTVVASTPSESPEEGIAVSSGRIVLITPVREETRYMYDTLRRLAVQFQTDNLVKRHMDIYTRLVESYHDSLDLLMAATENSEELAGSVKQLRARMKQIVVKVAATDAKFVQAVDTAGQGALEHIWVWIYNFVASDYVGEYVPNDQVWLVG